MTNDTPAPTTRQQARQVLRERLRVAAGHEELDPAAKFLPWSAMAQDLLAGRCIVYRLCPCGCGTYDIAVTSHQV